MPVYSFADSILVKDTAPEVYVVEKGDTLWDISNMYLDKPWQWPELWRTNIHITNPHLIYPGDELRLVKNEKGETVLDVVRESPKPEIKLSPEGVKALKEPNAIPALPWSIIKPYIENEMIMSQQAYDRYPYILGDHEGAVRYATDSLVLGKAARRSKENLSIVRKQNELFDMEGNFIGLQVRHLAKAKLVDADLDNQALIKILEAKLEVKRGDKIIPAVKNEPDEVLLVAAEDQTGFIIDDLEQHNLLGKYNVVVLDIGSDQVSAGTIMGIYSQGPRIIDGKQPKYEGESDMIRSAFNMGDEISQPAMKVGELVVFKAFDTASYALITKSAKVIKRGMIVAKP
ncbi:LysM peptidoglycan-binding domain-containing protein [Paraglaciecola arctica]|uniref:Peptidoglycan-binding LysM n=1 Tax=Paraglaciecola arctica BSs20135 TaxID=493475 RepID=K6Z0V6_9ALTE|nr:LysM domain-containing protein [Paraglaciecola arctica]GAC17105.1 peptidoglycan-binding LysM [Paraglaciecola arctica BSs20135]